MGCWLQGTLDFLLCWHDRGIGQLQAVVTAPVLAAVPEVLEQDFHPWKGSFARGAVEFLLLV